MGPGDLKIRQIYIGDNAPFGILGPSHVVRNLYVSLCLEVNWKPVQLL